MDNKYFVIVSTIMPEKDDSDIFIVAQAVCKSKNEAIDVIKDHFSDAINLIGDIWYSKNSNTRINILECSNKFGWNQIAKISIKKEE